MIQSDEGDQTGSSARTTGVLFIAALLLGLAFSIPVPEGAGFLTELAANAGVVTAGALLMVLAAATSAGIAISLYPMLKAAHPRLALAAVVFRSIEATFYLVGVVSLLAVLRLSTAGAEGAASEAVGAMLLNVREEATLVAVLAFSVGALMYYAAFFRSRLVPRWLSGWGLVAIVLTLTACGLALVGRRPVTSYALLVLPIAVQELVLGVWLTIKGIRIGRTSVLPIGAQA